MKLNFIKDTSIVLAVFVLLSFGFVSCSKSKKTDVQSAKLAGFWTYREDLNNDYWPANVLFLNNGTFRMYQAVNLADTAYQQAIADTANQVITFGTFTVNGENVNMKYTEFNIVDFTFTGTLNSNSTMLMGTLTSNQPNSASPVWHLVKH
jgi:hypothetical protein